MNADERDLQILRRPAVEKLTGLSITTLDRYEKRGNFCKRVKLGPRAMGWKRGDVLAWVRGRK